MTSSSPSETTAPKLITAAELREYLHLPAKDVAKELGMCLTSLKKVCRQHGILRWPYRRLKMIDRKIQSLEHHMAEGGEDQEDVRRQLEKLHSERAALPCNYGSSGLLDEAESDPSSPLSCASTTIHQQCDLFAGAASPPSAAEDEGASELDLDSCPSQSQSQSPPSMTPPKPDPASLSHPANSSSSSSVSASASAAAATVAPMTAAAALISSLPAAASPRPHARAAAARKAEQQQAAQQQQQHLVENEAVSPRGVEADGSMRVELSLSAELASQVAQGAQLVVHQDKHGRATLQIIPVGAKTPTTLPLPQGLARAPAPAPVKPEPAQPEGSDEDMIAALVGCAAEKALGAGGGAEGEGSAGQGGEEQGAEEEMSDEALALALAGCVRSDAEGGKPEGEEEGCEFVGCGELGEGAEWYQEEAGDEAHHHHHHHHHEHEEDGDGDGGGLGCDLDMSLFDQDA